MYTKRRTHRTNRSSLGTPPGSLVSTQPGTPTQIEIISFSKNSVAERSVTVEAGGDVPDLPAAPDGGVRWINVVGVHDGGVIRSIGETQGMHILYMEDVQNTDQRPKLSVAERTLFAAVRMVSVAESRGEVDFEHVSLFSSENTVITFQEREGDVFAGIRDRIRAGRGRVRSRGADYLVYALLDAVIDATFPAMDFAQERVEDLEEAIIAHRDGSLLSQLHALRGQVISLRRAIRPLREMLMSVVRGEDAFFSDETRLYLEDGLDHVLALLDAVDGHADRVTGLFQLHASMVGTSTNEVMRVLTIIATIFIPLTFVAGIYGMNFAVMPELQWRWGYPAILAVMMGIAVGMVVFFRRRKWL